MGERTPEQAGKGIEIREITEQEIPVWDRAVMRGFLSPHHPEGNDARRKQFEPGRWQAAFDHTAGGSCVATYRSLDLELTVPGGATLPVNAITGVTVTSTHRRRGLLSGMMHRDLAAARERGSVAAVLSAAEYNIYGRFGFGPSTRAHGWRIDIGRSGGLRAGLPEAPGGRIDFAELAEIRRIGPELHNRWRLLQPGALSRPPTWWPLETGELTLPSRGWKEPFNALHRDTDGQVTGLVTYRVDGKWDGSLADGTLTVTDFLALDRATATALWRLVLSVDWVRRVEVGNIGPDDPLPLLLVNPRAATPHEGNYDFTWLRLLDLPAAFGARSYATPGRVILQVDDPLGWTTGRWALEASPDGTGRCTPTDDTPDLTLGVSELSSLYLGAETAPRLAAAALVTEHTPTAAARLDLLLRTPLKAWNPDYV
ncbi:GNAT family N-acetyltransferase [Kitasatospora sp. McL0602]|uniref:GNAT family N-acetyltransferase n=1 Tax=Kitasatospora sp. McL0602 TaxID=3439530 RepID=UPI003F8A609E